MCYQDVIQCQLYALPTSSSCEQTILLLQGFANLYGSGFEWGLHPSIMNSSTCEDTIYRLYQEYHEGMDQSSTISTIPLICVHIKWYQNTNDHQGTEPIEFYVFQQEELSTTLRQIFEHRWLHMQEAIVAQEPPLRLYIGGDRSQVGKSTVSLGILGALLRHGYKPHELAYIKPATQCEAQQLISRFCYTHGIACEGIGPIVFYTGFTRDFLALEKHEVEIRREELLNEASEAVKRISNGKRFVLIDGVGYPAVGSVCGISNAAVASKLLAPVLLVGRKGVGDAIDAFNLNATYFEAHGVPVLGGIFNRLPVDSSYYNLENCKASILNYFEKCNTSVLGIIKKPYGFLPDVQIPDIPLDNTETDNTSSNCRPAAPPQPQPMSPKDVKFAEQIVNLFISEVNITELLQDTLEYQAHKNKGAVETKEMYMNGNNNSSGTTRNIRKSNEVTQVASDQLPIKKRRTRIEIEAEANRAGGSSG